MLGETNATALSLAAIVHDSYLRECTPRGLADLAAAFSTFGLEAHGIHQAIADAAAEQLLGGPAGGERPEALGADEGWDDEQLERLVRGLLPRRGGVDLAPLMAAVQVCGVCEGGDTACRPC